MPKYYCHRCGVSLGKITPVSSSRLDDNLYKLEKFIKHTAPSSLEQKLHSVFDDPSYSTYTDYVVNTSASGFVEEDDQGRTNMIWYAGSRVGITYRNGIFAVPADAVKLVYHDNDEKIHLIPLQSAPYKTARCENCEILLVVYP